MARFVTKRGKGVVLHKVEDVAILEGYITDLTWDDDNLNRVRNLKINFYVTEVALAKSKTDLSRCSGKRILIKILG